MTTQWQATFTGRAKGAIGIHRGIWAQAQGDTKEEARLSLYEEWEHIVELNLVPFRSTVDEPEVREEVESLVRFQFSLHVDTKVDCFYEHNGWWVKFWNLPADEDLDEVTYKVVDTATGLELEEL